MSNGRRMTGAAPATPGSGTARAVRPAEESLAGRCSSSTAAILDFGLYRIMAMKAGEIEAFLDRDLLPQVKEVLAGVANEEQAALEGALAQAREQARQLGVDP